MRAVIKPDPRHDWYGVYSTIVEGITAFGTRAELLADDQARVTAGDFDEADRTGSSNPYLPLSHVPWEVREDLALARF